MYLYNILIERPRLPEKKITINTFRISWSTGISFCIRKGTGP